MSKIDLTVDEYHCVNTVDDFISVHKTATKPLGLFILRRYVEVYPNICPILMVFLYF